MAESKVDKYVARFANILVLGFAGWLLLGPNGAVSGKLVEIRAEHRQQMLIDSLWEELVRVGSVVVGDRDDVRMVEFGDYECPFCIEQHQTVRSARGRGGIVYLQYPLRIHRNAYGAARAALCSEEQGFFVPMHNALFETDGWPVSADWAGLAARVGIPDSTQFEACINGPAVDATIRLHMGLANVLGIKGTPAIFLRDRYMQGQIGLSDLNVLLE